MNEGSNCSITFAAKVNSFNANLEFTGILPPGFEIMNPFRENQCASPASRAFYDKFYNDCRERGIILGINPGRFGAGITGVPFTDPKRLKEYCGIDLPGCPAAHEPSSQFVYKVIMAYGGVREFYKDWYINSICPLGFVRIGKTRVNANYYDLASLMTAAEPFMVKTLWEQLDFGIDRKVCICLGKGKNSAFLEKLNKKHGFFKKILALEHPRFIIQYRSRELAAYVDKYISVLKDHLPGN